jgi:hypothetical protein
MANRNKPTYEDLVLGLRFVNGPPANDRLQHLYICNIFRLDFQRVAIHYDEIGKFTDLH